MIIYIQWKTNDNFHCFCDFIEFNFANNEMESKRKFSFLNGKSLAVQLPKAKVTSEAKYFVFICVFTVTGKHRNDQRNKNSVMLTHIWSPVLSN